VFALHPLVVEPVAWAIGTKDLLAAALALGGLLAWAPVPTDVGGGSASPRQPGGGDLSLGVGAILLLLALGSKASVVLVPAKPSAAKRSRAAATIASRVRAASSAVRRTGVLPTSA